MKEMNHIDATSDRSRRMTKNNKDKRNSAGDVRSCPDTRPSGDTVGELGCFSSPETNPRPDRRAGVSSNLINRECFAITRALSMPSRVDFGDSPSRRE